MSEIKGTMVRGWRIGIVEPDGLSCYFDPYSERVEIHPLTPEEKRFILDTKVSVSELAEAERDEVYEQGRYEFDCKGDPQ